MLYYLAKLGRKPWAKYIVPGVNISACAGYLIFHCYGHNFAQNLLVAEDVDGTRHIISEDLKNLIRGVYKDAQPYLARRRGLNLEFRNPIFNWFCSSTLEPVSLGSSMLSTKNGSTIGVPDRYNYNNVEDLPDDFLVLRKLNLFRRATKKSKDKEASKDNSDEGKSLEEELKSELEGEYSGSLTLTKIDKDLPEAKIYTEALILSENAKKFSIAREIYSCDNSRILIKYSIYVLSGLFALYIARAGALKLNPQQTNLLHRLPAYLLGGLAGYGNGVMCAEACETYYQLDNDKRAMRLGQSYKEGAIEYYTKILARNKAFRVLSPDDKYNFLEDGEPNRKLLVKFIRLTYKQLLENAQNFESPANVGQN